MAEVGVTEPAERSGWGAAYDSRYAQYSLSVVFEVSVSDEVFRATHVVEVYSG